MSYQHTSGRLLLRRLARRGPPRDADPAPERHRQGLTSDLGSRALLSRYAVAWVYFAGFVIAESVFAVLSPPREASVVAWASTNVVNLHHHPIGALVASAFVPVTLTSFWPLAIALALFPANRVLGNWRTALLCVAGQVLGTLVSEGIVNYRVNHQLLPASYAQIVDVGPSYVVVSVIAVAVLYGSLAARIAAAANLAVLIFVSGLFSGLTHLDVAAVGHVTALVVSVVLGTLLVYQRRRRARGPAAETPSQPPLAVHGAGSVGP